MGIAGDLYQEYVKGGEARIRSAVESQEPESLYLDFKSSATDDGALTKKDRANLGQNLSGFANAQGGILVWGVYSQNTDAKQPHPKASGLRPIPNIGRFVQELNSASGQLVQRPVDGVVNHPINIEDGTGYAVTLIPASSRRPHMSMAADEKRYYVRSGAQTLAIDHVMVEALMVATTKPELRLVIDALGKEPLEMEEKRLHLAIDNIGEVSATNVAVSLFSYNNRSYEGRLDLMHGSIVRLRALDGTFRHAMQFRTPLGMPLYPGTRIHGIETIFKFDARRPIMPPDLLERVISWRINADGYFTSGKLYMPRDETEIPLTLGW